MPDVVRAALLEFLTFGYVAGDGAIFAGMSRLAPGSMLVLDRGRAPRVRPLLDVARDTDAGIPEGEYLERLGAELDEAVRIRLRSDVPLGAFLSGGLDSAAVLALMARHSSRPVQDVLDRLRRSGVRRAGRRARDRARVRRGPSRVAR